MNTINVAELLAVRLTSSSFDVLDEKNVFSGGNIQISCDLALTDGKIESPETEIDDYHLRGDCNVTVEAMSDDNQSLFKYSGKYVAIFNVLNTKIFFEQNETVRADYCLEKIYPLIREDLMSCFNRADLRQIYLPYRFTSND